MVGIAPKVGFAAPKSEFDGADVAAPPRLNIPPAAGAELAAPAAFPPNVEPGLGVVSVIEGTAGVDVAEDAAAVPNMLGLFPPNAPPPAAGAAGAPPNKLDPGCAPELGVADAVPNMFDAAGALVVDDAVPNNDGAAAGVDDAAPNSDGVAGLEAAPPNIFADGVDAVPAVEPNPPLDVDAGVVENAKPAVCDGAGVVEPNSPPADVDGVFVAPVEKRPPVGAADAALPNKLPPVALLF
jgi:hypothetical protein